MKGADSRVSFTRLLTTNCTAHLHCQESPQLCFLYEALFLIICELLFQTAHHRSMAAANTYVH